MHIPNVLNFTIRILETNWRQIGEKLETVGKKVGQLIFGHNLHYFVPETILCVGCGYNLVVAGRKILIF